ncbi:MAG: hypothetical protein KBC48_02545 [Candidatus Pacebacteria bacterium]|nr:hypothetical protein [Candidatus Paceibacterota bacterium]
MITDLALIEPWVLGMYLLMATAFTIPIVILLVVAMKRPDKNAHLAKEIAAGHVGEHVSYEDEEPEVNNPASADAMPATPQPKLRKHLPRRQVVRWLDKEIVYATTWHRKPFYGKVVGRKRGEIVLERQFGCPIRVRQPQP